MSKISEFFGLYCKNTLLDFKQAMEMQMCPYTQRVCIKMIHTRVSIDSAGIAKCLGLNAESKVELQELICILETKLIEEHRLRIRISG